MTTTWKQRKAASGLPGLPVRNVVRPADTTVESGTSNFASDAKNKEDEKQNTRTSEVMSQSVNTTKANERQEKKSQPDIGWTDIKRDERSGKVADSIAPPLSKPVTTTSANENAQQKGSYNTEPPDWGKSSDRLSSGGEKHRDEFTTSTPVKNEKPKRKEPYAFMKVVESVEEHRRGVTAFVANFLGSQTANDSFEQQAGMKSQTSDYEMSLRRTEENREVDSPRVTSNTNRRPLELLLLPDRLCDTAGCFRSADDLKRYGWSRQPWKSRQKARKSRSNDVRMGTHTDSMRSPYSSISYEGKFPSPPQSSRQRFATPCLSDCSSRRQQRAFTANRFSGRRSRRSKNRRSKSRQSVSRWNKPPSCGMESTPSIQQMIRAREEDYTDYDSSDGEVPSNDEIVVPPNNVNAGWQNSLPSSPDSAWGPETANLRPNHIYDNIPRDLRPRAITSSSSIYHESAFAETTAGPERNGVALINEGLPLMNSPFSEKRFLGSSSKEQRKVSEARITDAPSDAWSTSSTPSGIAPSSMTSSALPGAISEQESSRTMKAKNVKADKKADFQREALPSTSSFSNDPFCICNLPIAVVICLKCGNSHRGRVAKKCEVHPLKEANGITNCHGCASTILQEVELLLQ